MKPWATCTVLAVLVVSAVSSALATAAEANYHSSGGGVTAISGSGGGYFQFTMGNGAAARLECESTFAGELEETQSTLTLTPTFEECELAGLAATVHMNGCAFTNTEPETLALDTTTESVDIACPPSKAITITAVGGCVIHIPPQGPGAHMFSHNHWLWVTTTYTVTNLNYMVATGCPKTTETVTHKDGEYVDTVTLAGESEEGSAVEIAVT